GGTSTLLGTASPYRISVDSTNIYWTDVTAGAVRKMPKSGGSITTLATGSNMPGGIKTDGVNVYWSEFSSPGAIRHVSVNGGPITVIGNNVNNIGLALDPSS